MLIVTKKFDSIIEFDHRNDIKFSSVCKRDLQWKIESEKINIGKEGSSSVVYDDIPKKDITLDEIKQKSPVHIKYIPLFSGKYKLTISYAYKNVNNAGRRDDIRFFDEYGQRYDGNWATYFEVYSIVYILGVFSLLITTFLSLLGLLGLMWR